MVFRVARHAGYRAMHHEMAHAPAWVSASSWTWLSRRVGVSVSPLAFDMDIPGEHALARSRFSPKENGCIGFTHLIREAVDFSHYSRVANDESDADFFDCSALEQNVFIGDVLESLGFFNDRGEDFRNADEKILILRCKNATCKAGI